MEFMFGIGVGLLAGWVLLPAPKAVTDFWKRMFGGY